MEMRQGDEVLDPEGWEAETTRVARGIRRRVLAHVLAEGGGYLSQACSAAELLATLYTRVMRLGPRVGNAEPQPFVGPPGPANPTAESGARFNGRRDPDLDRFFFSPVHYSVALYAALIEVGRLAPAALDQFNRDGSTVELIGAEHSPGIEVTAGSLAQTLSQAGGVALARSLRGERGNTWVFLSDGELQEGQTWEALAALSHYRLDSVGIFVDVNCQQCDGPMAGVMATEPLAERLRAFGALVYEVDGHDCAALAALAYHPWRRRPWRRQGAEGAPLVVLARTNPCQGLPFLERRRPRLHYVRLHDARERRAAERAFEVLRGEGVADADEES